MKTYNIKTVNREKSLFPTLTIYPKTNMRRAYMIFNVDAVKEFKLSAGDYIEFAEKEGKFIIFKSDIDNGFVLKQTFKGTRSLYLYNKYLIPDLILDTIGKINDSVYCTLEHNYDGIAELTNIHCTLEHDGIAELTNVTYKTID